jgi:hypothetical protein
MGNMEKGSESFCFKPMEFLVLEVRWKNRKPNEYVPLVEKFIDVQQEEIKSRLGPEANDDILVRELLKLLLTKWYPGPRFRNDPTKGGNHEGVLDPC